MLKSHLQPWDSAPSAQELDRIDVLGLESVALNDAEQGGGGALEEVGHEGLESFSGDGALRMGIKGYRKRFAVWMRIWGALLIRQDVYSGIRQTWKSLPS